MLLENLRFHPEEEKNDAAFAKALASLADRYVNDAFGAAHRAHASVEGDHASSVKRPAAGLLMEQELKYLGHALESPERPFVAILGGAKVSDKIDVIENLLGKVDRLLIGGAMAYTFFKSRGLPIGKSLVEDDKLDAARGRLTADAAQRGVAARAAGRSRRHRSRRGGSANEVLAVGDPAIGDRLGVDIGPATIKAYAAAIAGAKTVVWNGPMGVFEIEAFAAGTNARGARGGGGRRHDDHRRRRLDRGGEEGGRRRPDHAHLDRRRRVARVPRRPRRCPASPRWRSRTSPKA